MKFDFEGYRAQLYYHDAPWRGVRLFYVILVIALVISMVELREMILALSNRVEGS